MVIDSVMQKSKWRWLIPLILILTLTSCLGGGGTDDNPAAGVEPDGQSLNGGEPLVDEGFELPTEADLDTLVDDGFDAESTGTPDVALFGNDQESDDGGLLGGDTTGDAFGLDATESTGDLFPNGAAAATPEM